MSDDWIDAADAADRLGATLFVITDCNPFAAGSGDGDGTLTGQLAELLDERGSDYWEAIAFGRDGSWEADGFAVASIGRKAARAIGREVGLDVIFEVTADELIVHGCSTTWQRRRPIDGERQDGVERADLFESAKASLQLDIDAPFKRARWGGWEYEGSTSLPCQYCGSELHLFGNCLPLRSGGLYRAMAIVCPGEGRARLPVHHVAYLPALQLWRAFATARGDADDRGLVDRGYWAYVIELADSVGPRLGDEPWVYVGQSARSPEERFGQHLAGHKSSRWAREHGVRLRSDLYDDQPVLRTQDEATTYEAFLAERLRLEGYSVKGGH